MSDNARVEIRVPYKYEVAMMRVKDIPTMQFLGRIYWNTHSKSYTVIDWAWEFHNKILEDSLSTDITLLIQLLLGCVRADHGTHTSEFLIRDVSKYMYVNDQIPYSPSVSILVI